MQHIENPTETLSFLVSAQLSDFTSISPSVLRFAERPNIFEKVVRNRAKISLHGHNIRDVGR